MLSDRVRLRSTRNIIVSAIVFSAITVSSTVLPSPAAASNGTACSINIGGQQGYYICGTNRTSYSFSSGWQVTMVIGMDHAVWTIGQYRTQLACCWSSLGGWARKGVYSWYANNRDDFGIWTYGSDGRRWCKYYYYGYGDPPFWKPWNLC